jgi:hypothetical protein
MERPAYAVVAGAACAWGAPELVALPGPWNDSGTCAGGVLPGCSDGGGSVEVGKTRGEGGILSGCGSCDLAETQRNCVSGRLEVLSKMWRAHSCVPCRDSSRHLVCGLISKRRDESRRGTHECARHIQQRSWYSTNEEKNK